MRLEDVIAAYTKLSPAQQARVAADAIAATRTRRWVPNPGPQTEGYFSLADEVFYGGEPGGGKSDLGMGLALTAHQRSLLLRRTNKEAAGLVDRMEGMLGTRDGWNSQEALWKLPGRRIDIGGCQLESDKQKYKGKPHDLIFFDELPDFLEGQYRFITIWNRSTDPEQRCRVVAAGNPPTTAEGLWVIRYWGPWLDPHHPNPARPGELRWFLEDREYPGPGPYPIEVNGQMQMILARSRTFIPADLADNPDLSRTGYSSVLASLSGDLREAYFKGNFAVGLKDKPGQVVPTQWIREATLRWQPKPPSGVPQCAIALDVSGGGPDPNVLSLRHDAWFGPLVVVPGLETPLGSECAGLIVTHRRNDSTVIVDMGGGYGGATYLRLRDNSIPAIPYKGAEKTTRRTADGKYGFTNVRSAAYWGIREALDPDQPQGSPVALPDDPELVADLTAATFRIGARGIEVESKESVCARLGRSTDKGDAVVMCWWAGPKAASHLMSWEEQGLNGGAARAPKVTYGPRHPLGLYRRGK